MNTKILRLGLIVCLILSVSCSLGGPNMAETADIAVIDGEDAGATPWEFDSIVEEGSNVLTLDASAKHEGSYGYKILVDGTSENCYGSKIISSALSSVYPRLYFYIPITGFPYDGHTGAARCMGILTLEGGGNLILRLDLSLNDTVCQFYRIACRDGWGWANDYFSDAISKGVWHYVDVYHKKDGSAGECAVWFDGVSVGGLTNKDTDNYNYGSVNVGIRYPGVATDMSPNQYFFIDDFLIATTGPIGEYSGMTPATAGVDFPPFLFWSR